MMVLGSSGRATSALPVFLNIWVAIPWGGSNDPFTGVTHQISCISDMYIIIHNSNIIVIKYQQNNLGGHHHNIRNCIKGSQH